jgi:hypothetical protein
MLYQEFPAKCFPPLDHESLATEARVLLDRWIRLNVSS